MVFHQPLIPVLPVAKEILSKTKLIGSSRGHNDGDTSHPRTGKEADSKKRTLTKLHLPVIGRSRSLHSKQIKKSAQRADVPLYTSQPLISEPEALVVDEIGVIQTPRSSGTFHHPSNHSSSLA